MEQTSPGFNERYLLDSLRFQTELTEYKNYIKNMIELAGVGNRSIEFANEILNFSKNVASVIIIIITKKFSLFYQLYVFSTNKSMNCFSDHGESRTKAQCRSSYLRYNYRRITRADRFVHATGDRINACES